MENPFDLIANLSIFPIQWLPLQHINLRETVRHRDIAELPDRNRKKKNPCPKRWRERKPTWIWEEATTGSGLWLFFADGTAAAGGAFETKTVEEPCAELPRLDDAAA
jgi:hypothetical protein